VLSYRRYVADIGTYQLSARFGVNIKHEESLGSPAREGKTRSFI